MTYRGHIENGMIVLDEEAHLPEGAQVVVGIDFLAARAKPINPIGLWKGSPEITEEDIAQARQEMWGNFPRDDI